MIHTVMDFGVNIFGKAALLFLIEGSRFLEFTVLSEISIWDPVIRRKEPHSAILPGIFLCIDSWKVDSYLICLCMCSESREQLDPSEHQRDPADAVDGAGDVVLRHQHGIGRP